VDDIAKEHETSTHTACRLPHKSRSLEPDRIRASLEVGKTWEHCLNDVTQYRTLVAICGRHMFASSHARRELLVLPLKLTVAWPTLIAARHSGHSGPTVAGQFVKKRLHWFVRIVEPSEKHQSKLRERLLVKRKRRGIPRVQARLPEDGRASRRRASRNCMRNS